MRQLQNWWKSIKSNLPPYYEVEGLLKAKNADTDGEPYIIVNSEAIKVDEVTYSRLTVGDSLKVRYTRGTRAISIDRFTSHVNGRSEDAAPN